MKKVVIAVVLSLIVSLGVRVPAGDTLRVTQGRPVEDPIEQALTVYNAAVAKEKAKLLLVIEAEKTAATKKGDLESAMKLKAMADEYRVVELEAPAGKKSKAIGKWRWLIDGALIVINENGTCSHSGIGGGTWEEKNKKVVLNWAGGRFIDTMAVVGNGNKLEGTALDGHRLTAERIKEGK